MKRSLYRLLFGTSSVESASVYTESVNLNDPIRLPAEWEPHQRTFMVWPQSQRIWSSELLHLVRKDIAKIANTISNFEPVVMLADPSQVPMAQSQLDKRIEVVAMPVNDLWARDTLPVFVFRKSNGLERLMGVDFNFNGWGKKQVHDKDAQIARRVVEMLNVEGRRSLIVGEGGSFETDGNGTLLATKSSLVNKNRNKKTIEEIEMELKAVLGVKKIIWFKGLKGCDVTDAHVDGFVRFVRPGVVILNRPFGRKCNAEWVALTNEAATVLKNSTDADGNPFEIIELSEPNPRKIAYYDDEEMFCSSYVNFFIGNGCVIIPAFGDNEADSRARTTLQEQFPDRRVVSLSVNNLAAGGGGIHCATHEQPH